MTDNLSVAFETASVSASLVALNGQVCKVFMSRETIAEGPFGHIFDVSSLPAGIYLLRVQIGSESKVTKVTERRV